MIVKEVADIIEALAPLEYAEDFDNTGLLAGDPGMQVTGILVTLDTLEHVVDEAISRNCNLIVSFHPILFKGLKKLTGSDYVQRTVMKAIRHDIALYAIHTALDNCSEGVNAGISKALGLQQTRILIPQEGNLRKLSTYVPLASAESLKEALFEAGAGNIGRYSHCSFSVAGTGSYRAGEGANPAKGAVGKIHYEEEAQLQLVFPKDREKAVIRALLKTHPYEEAAYEINALENTNPYIGMGMIGSLPEKMDESVFLAYVKERMKTPVIRHSDFMGKPIKKVAVLGGSGAFAIGAAKAAGADAFISSDFKYHQFFEAEGKLLIADVGHYESEQFTKNLLVDYLNEKIPNFAIALSESITNPVKYYF